MTEYKPGMFGLSIIGGKTGRLVAAGQALTGDGSRYTHAFMIVDNQEIVEAMPEGARIYPLSFRADDDGGIVVTDAPVQRALANFDKHFGNTGFFDDIRAQYETALREQIVEYARSLEGTPYNFADYFLLALAHLGIKADWLRKRVDDKGHMICSQLVDEVYRGVGIHLFDDNRLPMDVTPGDLDIWRLANWRFG